MSQHRVLTLEKKTVTPLLQEFEPATFRSQAWCSNHWVIPAPQQYSFMDEMVTLYLYSFPNETSNSQSSQSFITVKSVVLLVFISWWSLKQSKQPKLHNSKIIIWPFDKPQVFSLLIYIWALYIWALYIRALYIWALYIWALYIRALYIWALYIYEPYIYEPYIYEPYIYEPYIYNLYYEPVPKGAPSNTSSICGLALILMVNYFIFTVHLTLQRRLWRGTKAVMNKLNIKEHTKKMKDVTFLHTKWPPKKWDTSAWSADIICPDAELA